MVYLIHIDKPVAHMRHYVGTADQEQLPADNPFGAGCHGATWLKERTAAAGITPSVVRTWPDEGKSRELRLRNCPPSLAQFCPDCSGPAAYRRGAGKPSKRPKNAAYINPYIRKAEQDAFCLSCVLPDCVGTESAKCPINIEQRRRRREYQKHRSAAATTRRPSRARTHRGPADDQPPEWRR